MTNTNFHPSVHPSLYTRVWDTYNATCPYGGYWDFDYVVRDVNYFLSDMLNYSFDINSVDTLVDWIVGGLIDAS
jgi:hypothetical protein